FSKGTQRMQYQVMEEQGVINLSTKKPLSMLTRLKQGHTISFDLGFPIKGILMDDGISMTFQPCGYENVYRLLGKDWRSKPSFDVALLKQAYKPMVAKLFVQYKAQQNIGVVPVKGASYAGVLRYLNNWNNSDIEPIRDGAYCQDE
ncbi:MAG: hypothetical protein KGV48_002385, partial [Alcaligenaceae bacterium]|nr:hypothetical protein [Alcaligenaceae bacterium]